MRVLTCLLCLIGASMIAIAQDAPSAPAPKAEPENASMKLGEYWYGMYTPDGNTEGYAHINAVKADVGGVRVDWDLHITYEGGSYEEERVVTHDAQLRLRYSRVKTGKHDVSGEVAAESFDTKEGPVIKGRAIAPGKEREDEQEDISKPVKADATTGMGFVLATCLKLEKRAELTRTEYNEAGRFAEMGPFTLRVEGREEIEVPAGKFNAWKVLIKRTAGEMPVWISEDRRIVQIDWGKNNLMKLHSEPTKELFKPEPPAVQDLEPDNAKKLVVGGDFPGFTLDDMWKHWTTNELMAKWWPQEAEIEAKVGGKFIMKWKSEVGEPAWTLDGRIKALEEKKKLTFTWKWVQMPDSPELEVSVEFKEIEGGVNLKITHGPYENAEEKKDSGHLEGWQYFCTKLKNLKKK